jgi:hypothetical protein
MVPSSALVVTADGECLSYDGFSLSETICFGSLEFIANHLGSQRLSPMGNGSDAIVIGSARSRPPSPLRAMMGGSTEEFYTTSDGQGRIDLPSPRRDVAGASPAPPQLYCGRRALRPLKLQWLFHHGRQCHSQTPTSPSIDGKLVRTENEHKPMLSHLASSRRQHNDRMSSPADKRQLRSAHMSHRGESPCLRRRGF